MQRLKTKVADLLAPDSSSLSAVYISAPIRRSGSRCCPCAVSGHLERGLAYAGRGDHATAIVDFSEAIRRDPRLVVAHFGRAMAYEASGRGELAMVDLANAMRLDRNMVAALYMQRGYSLTQAAQHDRAIAAFTKSIEIKPNWLLAYFGRGAAYQGKGDTQRSASDYRKCLEFTATTELEQQRQQVAREQLEKLNE